MLQGAHNAGVTRIFIDPVLSVSVTCVCVRVCVSVCVVQGANDWVKVYPPDEKKAKAPAAKAE